MNSIEFQVSTQNTAGRITVAACNCTHWVSFFVLTAAVTDFMHVNLLPLIAERIPVHVPLVWRKPSFPRNRSADLASPAYNFNSDPAECAEDAALRSIPTDPIGRPEVAQEYMCERTRRKETSRFSASLTSFQDAQSSSGLLLNCGVDITSCTLPTSRTVECFVSDAWMLRTGWRLGQTLFADQMQ